MEPIHYIAFGLILVFVFSMWATANVIRGMSEAPDFEVKKLRFAAVTFTGITVLIMVIGILSIVSNTDKSFEIFEKVLTALSPIAGVIVGYLFSSNNSEGEK